MSIVYRIEQVAKKQGHTFKSLEREAGLGNGTIKRWEQQSPRLDGLKKVADYLQIPIDYLVYGDSKTATACDGVPLSADEVDLVAMYRLLDARDQKTIFDLTTLKYQQLPDDELPQKTVGQGTEKLPRIPFAASGWADITPEADSMIQEKLRQFEKRSLELKGKK